MDWLPLHFIRPLWLLALPLVVLLPLAWRHWRRPAGDWARVVDPHLLRWLSVGEGAARQHRSLGIWAAMLVLLVANLALAGPSWQKLPDSSFSARDARVLVLDLSMSMLAEDLKPNRLTRARFRLSDLLLETTEGQVGMVAFAGDAYVVAPLTNDTNTIANMLPALQPDVMPVAGSRADRALELAAELLQRSGAGRGEILLVTDDVEARAVDVAARLSRDGVVVSVLAVGTDQGAPIPSGSGFLTDAQGNVVIARLGSQNLRELVAAGNGRYSVLGPDSGSASPWQAGRGTEFDLREDSLGERWRDAGPWLVLLLLPLVAVGFRRGLLFSLVLCLSPLSLYSPGAQAGLWDDLWQRRDQQAQQALREERPGEAASLARDPAIAGEAWYRAGDYQRATGAWAEVDLAAAHYNRGNALALAGDLPGAVQAYQQALDYRPDFEDAVYNKALIEQLQEQQQQEQSEQGEGEDQNEPSDGEQQPSDQEGEQGEQQQGEGEQDSETQESEGGEQQQPGEPGEEQMAQAWSEEDAQAMEQWLRRIPDDPGGLLRRKFRNEHLRRGTPPEPAKTW
jgi:Ca-activated chloride channel family protein